MTWGGNAIKQQFRLHGFEHEGVYRDVYAQQTTLFSLINMVARRRFRHENSLVANFSRRNIDRYDALRCFSLRAQ